MKDPVVWGFLLRRQSVGSLDRLGLDRDSVEVTEEKLDSQEPENKKILRVEVRSLGLGRATAEVTEENLGECR